MFKISEFSKITGLTVKALRYYDQQGLLIPSVRHIDTSYRNYTEGDFERAELIKVLRSLDFSISEIKDILKGYENKEDLHYYLREKQSMIRHNIQKEKERISKIESYLLPVNHASRAVQYEISASETDAVNVISIRFKGKYCELDKYAALLYRIAKSDCNGSLINCYYDSECKKEADMELCLPVKRRIQNPETEYKTLPAVKGISTNHTGAYKDLNFAYKALFQYAARESIQLQTPSREIYRKGPGAIFRGNPAKYITEILIPF